MAAPGAAREELLSKAEVHEAAAAAILVVMERYLWSEEDGIYIAMNVRTMQKVSARVWLMGMPLWGGVAPKANAAAVAKNLFSEDMLSEWGFRSTSSKDPRYSNRNEITPYSNWRGPVWVNANAIVLYGLTHYGVANTTEVAKVLIHALADDLRRSGTWHECLSSAAGQGLAAPG